MKPIIWQSCYDSSWKGFITPASFSHPAKMSRGLLERIIAHGFEHGYWDKNSIIGDCFGGVGTTGIIGAYNGLRVVSVELEKKFVSLARRNYALHSDRWKRLGSPRPVLLQGDSRQFYKLVGQIDGTIASPPYAETAVEKHSTGVDMEKNWRTYKASGGGLSLEGYKEMQARHSQGYGKSDGQIAALKEGSLAAVVSSPPYADTTRGNNKEGIDWNKAAPTKKTSGRHQAPGLSASTEYGETPGQIGALSAGKLDGVVTSPPWEKNDAGGVGANKLKDPHKFAIEMSRLQRGHAASPEARKRQFKRDAQRTYGDSEGQIGKEAGETYWQAVNLVYRSCYQAIKPGGVIVLVVKNYVKAGKEVPLCDDTVRLLEHIGFTMIERIHALLVKETHHADLFNGHSTDTKSRKSFFRRLAEKKGSPKIDFEEVLVARRP